MLSLRDLWEDIRRYEQAAPYGGRYQGLQEGAQCRIVPVYRVRAWRSPNEDGASRPIWRDDTASIADLLFFGAIQDRGRSGLSTHPERGPDRPMSLYLYLRQPDYDH